jgi:hydrogenase maturation protease
MVRGDFEHPPATSLGLIVGLGNCLMRDDGIGVHVARELMREPLEGTLVLEVGTDVFSALSWMENASWVLAIDAMAAGGAPGTIYSCAGSEIAAAALPKSLHELGLLAVLEFLPPDRRPEIAVLGVEPEIVDYGLELSPALVKALPSAVEAARAMVFERRRSSATADAGMPAVRDYGQQAPRPR